MLTYVIGDIHGQALHFERMLARISEHAAERKHRIICVGDYINRGILTKEVLDILMSRPEIIALRGNHEQMLLDAVDGDGRDFMLNGGLQTLQSFVAHDVTDIPDEYIRFVDALPYSTEDARRFYVHAGIDPARSLDEQRERDMLWIRDPFLMCRFPFEKYVVHGHTPTYLYDVEALDNRCNVDAGCYASGRLVCAVFDDTHDQPIDTIMITPARRVPMA